MPDTYEYRKLESLNKLVAAEKRTEEAGKPARRNIYAVVAESWVEEVRVEGESEPRRSIIFRLMDESSVAAAMTTDGTLTAHFSGAKLPPLFKSGTILRAHRILAKSRTALPSRAELVGRLGEAGCHIVAWSIPDPPNLPSQLSSIYESSKNITFTPSDQERLEELTQWWRDEMDAGKRALALSPTADQKLAKVSVPDPGPLGRGRMVSCDVLSQLVPGSYYNLVLEVIGVLELSTGVVIVRAWDGSTPAIETARVDFKTEQTDPSEPPKLDEEKDALLFSDNWRKCYAVDIFIYDEFTREALAYEPGDVVLFWNCHAYFRKAPATALLPLDQGVQRKWVQTCLTFHGRRPNQLQHRSLQLLYQPAQPDQPLRDTHGSLALFRRSLAARLRALRSHVAREQRQNPIPLPSSSAAARNDDEDENEEESWQENFEEDVEAYERQLAAVKAAEKEKAAQAERERRRRGKNKREQPDSSLPLPLAGDESSVVSQSQDLPKTPKCSTTGDGKQQGSRTSERTKSPSKTQGIRTRSQSAKSSEASNSSYHTAMESQPSKPSTRGSGRKQTKEVEEASLSSHSPLHDSETELNLAPEVDESQSQDVWASQPVEKRVTRSKQAEKAVATGSSLQDHDDDGITISPIKTPKRHQSIGSPGGGVGRSGSESKRKRDERQPRRSPRTRASDSDSPILSSKKRKGNAKLDSSSSHDDDFHPLATSTLAAGESQPGEGITRDRRQLNAELKSQHQLSPISELSQEAPIEISSRSDLNDATTIAPMTPGSGRENGRSEAGGGELATGEEEGWEENEGEGRVEETGTKKKKERELLNLDLQALAERYDSLPLGLRFAVGEELQLHSTLPFFPNESRRALHFFLLTCVCGVEETGLPALRRFQAGGARCRHCQLPLQLQLRLSLHVALPPHTRLPPRSFLAASTRVPFLRLLLSSSKAEKILNLSAADALTRFLHSDDVGQDVWNRLQGIAQSSLHLRNAEMRHFPKRRSEHIVRHIYVHNIRFTHLRFPDSP